MAKDKKAFGNFLREMIKIVLDDVNKRNDTDYQQKDVYFDFDREIITNASDNAQIKQIEATTKATEINLLLGLNGVLDNETVIQLICEQLDIDYNEIKDKLPTNEAQESIGAMETLDNTPVDNVEGNVDNTQMEEDVLGMLEKLLNEVG